ncbi:phage major capsid protein [Nocardioides alkalitolerans]|uniref:phage major capsid protein n=1 Tax=Nocardioides alkalitolerans TaxID=281714 RepID=UPI00041B115A|nr:phage major capsid protein [Nocardioides alkalitolerans]
MPTSVELRQQRARVVESMRTMTDAAEAENRGLNAEERQAFDRHETDFTGLTERIGRQEALEQREAEEARSLGGGNRPDTGGGGNGDDPQERSRQHRSAFAAFIRRGVGGLAPEQRALVENAAGEILVPEDLESEILRELPGLTVMRELASQRTVTTNRIRRRSMGEVSVGWGKLETGEQELVDSMPGVPTEEYTYIEDLYGLAKIGEDEFDDTDVNLEAFVRDSFSRATGEAEDTAFAVGTGHPDKMPVGIFAPTALTGIPTVASAALNALSVDDFLALVYAVPPQYRRNGSFLMPSSTELHLSTKKDANGQYLWQPSVQAGRPNTFKGYAVNNQEDIGALGVGSRNVAAFGDYNAGYRVYDRLGMTVQRLVELYAEDGMIGFKVRRRVGGDVIRPQAIRVLRTPAGA